MWVTAGIASAYAVTGIALVAVGAQRPRMTVSPAVNRDQAGLTWIGRF
jgi:hypothetical protein